MGKEDSQWSDCDKDNEPVCRGMNPISTLMWEE